MPEHFVLDTGPLLDFLVLAYEAETGARWLRQHFPCIGIRNQTERELFEEFLKSRSGRLLTSSGVIAEMQSHVRGLERACWREQEKQVFRERFWRFVCDTFRQLAVGEETVRLVDLDQTALINYGPVDAGLLKLAQPIKRGVRRLVLTNDRWLVGLCRKQEIPAELAASWIRSLQERS